MSDDGRQLAEEVLTEMEQDCGPLDAEPYSSWAKQLAQKLLDALDREAQASR